MELILLIVIAVLAVISTVPAEQNADGAPLAANSKFTFENFVYPYVTVGSPAETGIVVNFNFPAASSVVKDHLRVSEL